MVKMVLGLVVVNLCLEQRVLIRTTETAQAGGGRWNEVARTRAATLGPEMTVRKLAALRPAVGQVGLLEVGNHGAELLGRRAWTQKTWDQVAAPDHTVRNAVQCAGRLPIIFKNQWGVLVRPA